MNFELIRLGEKIMKFRDIPQFTRSGNWECNYDLKSLVRAIEEWKEEGLQLNPDFQRGHVWTEDQQIKYMEFVLKGGKTARVVYLNHDGWDTGNKPSKDGFVCVDGLQRITAIQKFINNEIKVFGHYFNEYEDSVRLTNDIRVNVNSLKTRKEVLQWYLEFNAGGTIHTEEEINRVKKLLEEENQ
jgi:uncharacterized protein with ParB-like and HNH nuclease domain